MGEIPEWVKEIWEREKRDEERRKQKGYIEITNPEQLEHKIWGILRIATDRIQG